MYLFSLVLKLAARIQMSSSLNSPRKILLKLSVLSGFASCLDIQWRAGVLLTANVADSQIIFIFEEDFRDDEMFGNSSVSANLNKDTSLLQTWCVLALHVCVYVSSVVCACVSVCVCVCVCIHH